MNSVECSLFVEYLFFLFGLFLAGLFFCFDISFD